MGFIDWLRGTPEKVGLEPTKSSGSSVVVGAKSDSGDVLFETFNDKNITFTGDLAGYDYNALLRDKQNNIIPLYE